MSSTGTVRQSRPFCGSARAGLALMVAFFLGCGAAGARADSSARIRAAIADAPQCPAPPATFGPSGAREWLGACKQVAAVAADNVARGLAEAERLGDMAWKACLTDRYDTIVGLRRRIAAERIALGGLGAERATMRIRRHCTRVQLLVAEAQNCQ